MLGFDWFDWLYLGILIGMSIGIGVSAAIMRNAIKRGKWKRAEKPLHSIEKEPDADE